MYDELFNQNVLDDDWPDYLDTILDALEIQGVNPKGLGGVEGGEWSGRELD